MQVNGVLDMSEEHDQPNTTPSITTRSTTTRPRGQRLTKEQKRYIVELLGCSRTPSQVALAFQERFGMEVSPQAVHCYDPTKRAGARLSQQLCEVFDRARQEHEAEYRAHTHNIGVAQLAYRLQALQAAAEEYHERKNYLAMAAILEQAAKEVGDWYRK